MLFLQVIKDRAKGNLRGETEEIYQWRDEQESPGLMHQWVMAADLEQRGLKHGSAAVHASQVRKFAWPLT